jgi:hypothetical protein
MYLNTNLKLEFESEHVVVLLQVTRDCTPMTQTLRENILWIMHVLAGHVSTSGRVSPILRYMKHCYSQKVNREIRTAQNTHTHTEPCLPCFTSGVIYKPMGSEPRHSMRDCDAESNEQISMAVTLFTYILFESRTGYLLSWLRCVVVFLSSSRRILGSVPLLWKQGTNDSFHLTCWPLAIAIQCDSTLHPTACEIMPINKVVIFSLLPCLNWRTGNVTSFALKTSSAFLFVPKAYLKTLMTPEAAVHVDGRSLMFQDSRPVAVNCAISVSIWAAFDTAAYHDFRNFVQFHLV